MIYWLKIWWTDIYTAYVVYRSIRQSRDGSDITITHRRGIVDD